MSVVYGDKNVDLEGWARAGKVYEGSFLLRQMERLKPHLHDFGSSLQDEAVFAALQFGLDEEGLGFIEGRIDGTLLLTCQRCLQPAAHAVACEVRLCLVHTENSCVRVPETSDPLILNEFSGNLDDLVEDELLLDLPLVVFHPQNECLLEEGAKKALGHVIGNEEKTEQKNPFRALKQRLRESV